MAKLKGITQWCQVHKPGSKYGNFSLKLNMIPESQAEFKGLGLKNKPNVDDDGKLWYTFRAPAEKFGKPYKPYVVDKENKPITDLIGNGSAIEVELEVYEWKNEEFGSGKGSRIVGVTVHNLIPYVKPEPGADAPVATGTAEAAAPVTAATSSGMPW